MHPLLLSSAKLESVWKFCCPGLPSQSFTYTQLPLAEAFCKHTAFDPPNLKVVGVLHKIVKQQGRLLGQRATLSSPVSCPTGRQLLCPFTGDGTRCPPWAAQDTLDEKGWHVRQVPGRNRHNSRSNQVTEQHLMRICWQRCEQVDGNQEGLVQHSGTGNTGEPAPPAGLKGLGEGSQNHWVEWTHS